MMDFSPQFIKRRIDTTKIWGVYNTEGTLKQATNSDTEGDKMNIVAIDSLFDQINKLRRSTAFKYQQPNNL
tara:strand:- start:33 stop:245 length:213 start_codon:yes stop_codon:yes gene_type:complete